MNKIFIILILGLLFSCSTKMDNNETNKVKDVNDTITVIEKVIDTVYVDKIDENDIEYSEYYIQERLPLWFLKTKLLDGIKFNKEYEFNNRLNPLYLEADFNGDNNLDIAIPIKQVNSQKLGFAIIHGQTNEIHIIGAGTEVKNGLSDDMGYIDIWIVNREKVNDPGLEENTGSGDKGELILKNPSLEIAKSELGGGQIYWNGKEYAYFHQTC